MPGKGTTIRSVRVPDEVWEAAKARAESEGSSVSAVVQAALRRYVTRPPRSR
jgi:predicted HicB family RNase H-like nuclease